MSGVDQEGWGSGWRSADRLPKPWAAGSPLRARARACGSTFRLELKVVPQAARPNTARKHAKPSESLPPAPGRNNLRILLVEDNKDTLRYLATVLRKRGHQVVAADCCTAALAAIKEAEAPFELLISDIELPDGDGLQLMREIKAFEPMAGIAMSGFGAEEDLRHSREAGFFDHLDQADRPQAARQRHQERHRRRLGRQAENDTDPDDESEPFSLRSDGNSSGAFKIVWSVEPKPENLEP